MTFHFVVNFFLFALSFSVSVCGLQLFTQLTTGELCLNSDKVGNRDES